MIIEPMMEAVADNALDTELLKKFVKEYEKQLRANDWKSIVDSIESKSGSANMYKLILAIFDDILNDNILTKIDYIPSNLYRNNSQITKIEIPSNIKRINPNAFQGCENLQEVIMPDNVEQIGAQCFQDCKKLQKVRLSEKLKVIPAQCFKNCVSLKELFIPDSITNFDNYVFQGCSDDLVVKANRNVDRRVDPSNPEERKGFKAKQSTGEFLMGNKETGAKGHLVWANE